MLAWAAVTAVVYLVSVEMRTSSSGATYVNGYVAGYDAAQEGRGPAANIRRD